MIRGRGIVEVCERAWSARDLSTCKPLGFDIVGWIAILTAAVAALVFLIKHFRQATASSAGAVVVARKPWRSRFSALCAAIEPIMDENGRLFHEFGPNSGRVQGLPKVVRQDLTVWKQLIPKVVANNGRIRELITENERVIPQDQVPLFRQWINHIDAFEAHAMDDFADYRHNQFPVEVVDVIRRNA